MTRKNIQTDSRHQAEATKSQQACQERQQDEMDPGPPAQQSQAGRSAQRPTSGRMPLFRR